MTKSLRDNETTVKPQNKASTKALKRIFMKYNIDFLC